MIAISARGPIRLVRLGESPVDAQELDRAVRSPNAGAVIVFLGTTRDDAIEEGTVEALDYDAARPLADDELARIAAEAAQTFALTALAIHHTLGRVPVGVPSLGVAVSAPHRAEAFAAADWTVTAIKTRVPIWKRNILRGAQPGPWADGTPVRR